LRQPHAPALFFARVKAGSPERRQRALVFLGLFYAAGQDILEKSAEEKRSSLR
jgi:hypothetical protein